MQKYKCSIGKTMGCLMLTVLLLCGCAGGNDLEITTPGEVSQDTFRQQNVSQDTKEEEQTKETSEDDMFYVQVTGAVQNPGVYELSPGSRVFEAIEKAGGMTEDAKPESVNQALEVTDGQMIVLYTRQEWEQMSSETVQETSPDEQGGDSRININTATVEQLCSISGIGQSRAQSIVTYREKNGAFGKIEDIMKVSGIKEGLFEKIKDKIKV